MKKLVAIFVIYAVVLTLYYPVLTTYFSQDDFFHFKVSRTDGSLRQFFNLFGFHPFTERGIAFYRPISRELLFNPYYSIFGLEPLPFRILQLMIHLINILLVYILIQKIFQKKPLSFFVAFFFGISSAHVGSLYYLAGGIQSQVAAIFIISTLIFFIDYLKTRKNKLLALSFLTFLLSIGSHELAVITLLLLVGLLLVYVPLKLALSNLYRLWPFYLITVTYLYLDIFKIGFSSNEPQYNLVPQLKTTLNSLVWYGGWALGLPEMLIDFVLPGFKLNPTLMRYWGNYFIIIFATFAISLSILGLILLYFISRKRAIFYNKKFWFLLIWFPIGILPVLLLPFHKSTYYLVPALPAFWGALGFLIFSFYTDLKNKYPKAVLSIILLLFLNLFVLSATSIKLGETTYWASQRGKLAEKLINQMKSEYPTLPKGAVVYFKNDPSYPFVAEDWGGTSKQANLALNGSDALQLLYKDLTLRVFYEDLGGVPKNFPKSKVYSIVARIE